MFIARGVIEMKRLATRPEGADCLARTRRKDRREDAIVCMCRCFFFPFFHSSNLLCSSSDGKIVVLGNWLRGWGLELLSKALAQENSKVLKELHEVLTQPRSSSIRDHSSC